MESFRLTTTDSDFLILPRLVIDTLNARSSQLLLMNFDPGVCFGRKPCQWCQMSHIHSEFHKTYLAELKQTMLDLHVRDDRYLTNPTVISFEAMTHNLFPLPILDPQHVLSYHRSDKHATWLLTNIRRSLVPILYISMT